MQKIADLNMQNIAAMCNAMCNVALTVHCGGPAMCNAMPRGLGTWAIALQGPGVLCTERVKERTFETQPLADSQSAIYCVLGVPA